MAKWTPWDTPDLLGDLNGQIRDQKHIQIHIHRLNGWWAIQGVRYTLDSTQQLVTVGCRISAVHDLGVWDLGPWIWGWQWLLEWLFGAFGTCLLCVVVAYTYMICTYG